jgi:hypothetical protein
MLQWLYRYVLRGIGVVWIIGMITVLILAVGSKHHRPHEPATPAHTATP